ncbi:MAG: hypothetical protein JWR72_75 [Flavisolibacter sp.]|nr:hypothetical protein [Flavisolibacter sp.]
MSHNTERKEKNCLNCDTQVHGRFCHVCGQENIVTKEKFWSLAKHFVYDILHFDGQFFYTLKYIFTKPGFVARQYAEGKRASFIHPIRMYLFTSAIFFLIFFSVQRVNVGNDDIYAQMDNESRTELATAWQIKLDKNTKDTLLQKKISLLRDTFEKINPDDPIWQSESRSIQFGQRTYNSLPEYDSIQNTLADSEKDSWFQTLVYRQVIKLNEKYGRGNEGASALLEALLHKLPYFLFLSLPFFALILKLLYIRRKNFYYSDHAVFTLYHYILSFILLLIMFGFSALGGRTGWGIFTILNVVTVLSWPMYLYLQLKRFYQQSRLKTIGKFLLLNLLGFIIIVLLLVIFMLFSIFQL